MFVVPGTPTSANPVKAFAQGLADETSDQRYLLTGRRCTRCGFVELYAIERAAPPGPDPPAAGPCPADWDR